MLRLDSHIVTFHNQRSRQEHGPKHGLFVNVERFLQGLLVLGSVGLGGILHEVMVIANGGGQASVVSPDRLGRVELGNVCRVRHVEKGFVSLG